MNLIYQAHVCFRLFEQSNIGSRSLKESLIRFILYNARNVTTLGTQSPFLPTEEIINID